MYLDVYLGMRNPRWYKFLPNSPASFPACWFKFPNLNLLLAPGLSIEKWLARHELYSLKGFGYGLWLPFALTPAGTGPFVAGAGLSQGLLWSAPYPPLQGLSPEQESQKLIRLNCFI